MPIIRPVRTRYALLLLLLASIAFAQTPPTVDSHCRDILDKGLKDKNPDIRKEAVVALSLAGPQDAFIADLEAMLDDKDVEVRVATVASLVDLPNKRTLAALHKALEDEVPEVSFAAAKALWALNDPAGEEALISIVSGEAKTSSGFFTRQKREALRRLHTPKTAFVFVLTKGAAFAPVPGLGGGVASMEGLLSNPGVSGRATSALLLARDNKERTLQALRDALSDKDWSVRAAAVHSLALRNDPAVEADIVPLLEDKKEGVRLRAATGYLRLEMIKSRPKPPRAGKKPADTKAK